MKTTVKISALLVLSVFIVVGCATRGGVRTGSWGKFVPDRVVMTELEAGKLDPNMNYYFSGPESRPLAILGLDKRYLLDNRLWKPIADTRMCMELIACMKTTDVKEAVRPGPAVGGSGRNLIAFTMYGPNNDRVGVWYSEVDAKMRFRMGDGNKVVVYTPDQDVPTYSD